MELLLSSGVSINNNTKIDVSVNIFGVKFNKALVHQVTMSYMAGSRQGTKAQKNRSDVSGGGAKPWRQKGTGNARAGTIRSPIWRTGGLAFASRPRSFKQKVNRKMYQGAIRSILSELVRLNRLMVIKDAEVALDKPKTKILLNYLKNLKIQNALILINDWNINLYLASRNLSNIKICDVKKLDPLKLIKYRNVIVTEFSIRQIEKVLG